MSIHQFASLRDIPAKFSLLSAPSRSQEGSFRRPSLVVEPYHRPTRRAQARDVEGRILRDPLGAVHVFITSQAAVYRLAEQTGHSSWRVLSAAGLGHVLGDEFAESQTFVQLSHENQAAVRGDPRSLKIDPQGAVEGQLTRLAVFRPHGG